MGRLYLEIITFKLFLKNETHIIRVMHFYLFAHWRFYLKFFIALIFNAKPMQFELIVLVTCTFLAFYILSDFASEKYYLSILYAFNLLAPSIICPPVFALILLLFVIFISFQIFIIFDTKQKKNLFYTNHHEWSVCWR